MIAVARWLAGSEADIEKFAAGNRGGMAADRDGAPVFLAKSAWEARLSCRGEISGCENAEVDPGKRHEVNAES